MNSRNRSHGVAATRNRQNGPRLFRGLLVAAMCALAGPVPLPAQQSGRSGPPLPYVDEGVCPFEGCVYREWVANQAVVVRSARNRSAPILYRISRGTKVTALTGVVITMRAGRVRFRQPTELQVVAPIGSERSGTFHVPEDGVLRVGPGETLYLLTYYGEGFSSAWLNGRLYYQVDGSEFFDGRCADEPSRCKGQILERPQRVWWVQIKNALGQIGWTDEPEKFDGKDALS